MPAEVINLAGERIRRQAEADRQERLPLALIVHLGAVELIIGSPYSDGVELHMSPEQALELAEDLRRTALAAQTGGGRP